MKARQTGNQIHVQGFKTSEQMKAVINFVRKRAISPQKVLKLRPSSTSKGSLIIRLKSYEDCTTVRRMLSADLKIGIKSSSEEQKPVKLKTLGISTELAEILESENDLDGSFASNENKAGTPEEDKAKLSPQDGMPHFSAEGVIEADDLKQSRKLGPPVGLLTQERV
jgi:dynactin complex subunit